MTPSPRLALIALSAAAAALLAGCMHQPEPAYVPAPVMAPPPPPAPMAPPEAPSTGAAPDLDRGLPVCPGDPRCKKPG